MDDFEPAHRRMRKFYIAHFFLLVIYFSLLALFYFYMGRLFGINQLISTQIERIDYLFHAPWRFYWTHALNLAK